MNAPAEITPNDDPVLRETLKRCSSATYYAACKFRATGEAEALHSVVSGIIERFVDREARPQLSGPDATVAGLRLREDLGLDSLTMMEVILLTEEVTGVTIANEELTRLHTLGEVHAFLRAKVTAAGGGAEAGGTLDSDFSPAPAHAGATAAATRIGAEVSGVAQTHGMART